MLPSSADPDAALYQLVLQGHYSAATLALFEPVASAAEQGNTVLWCRLPDQAALHGVLKKVRDLNLPLLALVNTAYR